MSAPTLIVKALTVWQPHAGFIAHFGKDVENRGWMLNYRGPVIIHAGKQWEDYPELWAEVSDLFRRQGHTKHADLFHRNSKRMEWFLWGLCT